MNLHKPSASLQKNGQRADACHQCGVRHLAVCSAIEGCQLSDLEAITVHRKIAAGHGIFDEGDPAKFLYNISDGTIRLYKLLPNGRRQITGFLFAGDFLGLATNDSYSYGAEAVNDVNLCQLRATDFRALMEKHPELRTRLLEMANDELIAAQEQMLLLGRKTPSEKLASFFLRLSRNNEKWQLAPSPITLSMTREDIADYLGLTIETVSRTFTKLKTEGAITLGEQNKVQLNDFKRLQELAETF
jgi:CRP/FNR family transcriptional regulator